jgi:hypothetical protein
MHFELLDSRSKSVVRLGTHKILIPIKTPRITFTLRVIFRSFKITIGRNVKMRSCTQFRPTSISNESIKAFNCRDFTTEEVARVHLYIPTPAFSTNRRIP